MQKHKKKIIIGLILAMVIPGIVSIAANFM